MTISSIADNLSKKLVENYCLGKREYINMGNIIHAVYEVIVNMLENFVEKKIEIKEEDDVDQTSVCDFIDDGEYTNKLLNILFVVEEDIIDLRFNDIDLDVHEELVKCIFENRNNL